MDEWKKKQCRFTFPSSFHPPLPPPVRLSSVQLWLCDAKLTGAKLSSIHTLAYNALRLIPTHQCKASLSLSLSHRLSPPSRTAPTCTRPLPPLSLALSFPSFLLVVHPYSFVFSEVPPVFHPPSPHLLSVFLLFPRCRCAYTHKLILMLWLFNKF